jgi:methylated-DNA-[protein]-cysteine S-methyltransferase
MIVRSDLLTRAVVDSPVGPLTAVVGDDGVRALLWPDDQRPLLDEQVVDEPAAPQVHVDLLDRVRRQLAEYFAGARREFDLPLDPQGTEFQREAWGVLRTISYGSTITYREQASALGDPNRARAVGAANGRNPISIIVPCHRVVATSGALTGFAGGLPTKAWLLEHERRVVAGG